MGRIEEEREAARQAERVLLKQRQEEQRKKESANSEHRFSERLTAQDRERARSQQLSSQRKTEQVQTEAKHKEGEKLAESQVQSQTGQKESVDHARARKWLSERVERWRGGADADQQKAAEAHTSDKQQVARSVESHSSDERSNSDRGQSQKKSEGHSDALRSKAGAETEKEALQTDADGQGGSGKNNSQQDNSAGGSFRLNPALMAPVAVAKPRETSASERLRALANEIAQKIVERVRIGTNKSGMAEFQIDLRSNVLSGLNIQVSGTKGRIRAVFSGNDPKVLKLIRDQSESLKKALEGRGLKLEELRIEDKR
jgi:hypothetical protein